MADFDLTQTDQQVQNILNDGQSAMGAGAQTTLTTEYVMLKDTNGVYHKILKSSFTEAIRDVLAGLLVNNDKGTTINQIAAIASGDFGSITPANLASVLGEVVGGISQNADLNNYTANGAYICINGSAAQTVTNCPCNVAFRLEVLYFSPSVLIQKIISSDSDKVYIRTKITDNWGSWYKYQGTVVS